MDYWSVQVNFDNFCICMLKTGFKLKHQSCVSETGIYRRNFVINVVITILKIYYDY